MAPEISAVVCTRNRALYLEKSIGSLATQTLSPDQYQIIVVDNGSTDNTREIVGRQGATRNLLYIYEPIVGLSQARNTGWKNASGKYVAFLDDDAIAMPNWLETIMEKFSCIIPKPVSVGGKIMPIWEGERPDWLVKGMETYLGIIDWSAKPMFLADDKFYLPGSNLAYNLAFLEECGGFNTRLGRKGGNLLSNEEILIQKHIRRRNLPAWYDPTICVKHHIRAERLNRSWFYKRYYYQGASDAILDHHINTNDCLKWNRRRQLRLDIIQLFLASKKATSSFLLKTNNSVIQRCWACYWLGRFFADTRISADRL